PAEPPVRAAAAGDAVPPPAAGAIGSGGQRFVWLTGPQGRPLESAQTPEPPRPPAAIPETDVTASLGALLDGNDRVPTELALAYAAAPPRGADADLPRAGAVPSGAARIAPPAAAPRPATPPVAAAARPGQRADNPWLRSLIISPSMHYAMSVAALGEPDYRQLTRLMQKPASALALNFTTDPQAGMTSSTFSGPAVTFLPTIKFVTRTAGLN
ncbi:MAG TPA: hypothetical protein VEM36_02720, partial [Xanthobacteraceae bacterium]|nr:hypothetical protein [Xanthobacteraceae bacterium]